MRIVVHVAFFLFVFAIVGAIWPYVPFRHAPDVAAVFALYLGVSGMSPIWQATLGILVIGWLADVVNGAPVGLTSAVLGFTGIVLRAATARLLFRGTLLIAVFAAITGIAAGGLSLGLRIAIGMPAAPVRAELLALLQTAAASALLAPLLVRACRRIDARFARTQREREAIRDGFMT